MSETRVCHVNDKVDGAIYIGRAMPPSKKHPQGFPASPYANPFKIGDRVYGTTLSMTREDAIAAYHSKITGWGNELLAGLPELRGKALSCWCRRDGETPKPENACHGDLLVALLETHTDDELRGMTP